MKGIRLCIRYDWGGIEFWANKEGGDELGNGSGCHKTDAADVLTHEIQVRGIRLCTRYDWGGGIEFQASKEGGNELGNGSGCHRTDAADVLTHQI